MKGIKKMHNEIYESYKNNKIILWGAGEKGKLLSKVYCAYGIDVIAFIDKNEELQGSKYRGIPIISYQELHEIAKTEENILVDIAVDFNLYPSAEKEIIDKLEEINIKKYHYFPSQEKVKEQLQKAGFTFVGSGGDENNKIRITKIDQDLSIYKNNTVVLFIDSLNNIEMIGCRQVLELFEYHKIHIDFICEYTAEKCQGGGCIDDELLKNIPIISMEELGNMVKNDANIMLQLVVENNEAQLINEAEAMGIKQFVVLQEAKSILTYMFDDDTSMKMRHVVGKDKLSPEKLIFLEKHRRNQLYLNYLENHNSNNHLLICMMGKTGDHTLNRTFEQYDIPFCNMWHLPEHFVKSDYKPDAKIKIITAVRDPISVLLSGLYQKFSIFDSRFAQLDILNTTHPFMNEALLQNSGDLQYVFDEKIFMLLEKKILSISGFFQRFSEYILDIKHMPFDKEKGYSILKAGNIEVFAYQLEKMNGLSKELSDFIGTSFDSWVMGNVAADKWIADSYNQAKKEIKIQKEFFDMVYSDPWVSYFYSEEDIEKFKAHWRPHIREEQ